MVYIIAFIIIILDQISKHWALNTLKEIGSISVIENVFHLTYVENRGAAFGLFQNQKLFFVIATSIVVIGIIVFLVKHKNIYPALKWGLALVMGGGIGNLIDRIRFSYVIDLFDFRIWPVFNIADMAIVVGASLIAYTIIKYDSYEPKEM